MGQNDSMDETHNSDGVANIGYRPSEGCDRRLVPKNGNISTDSMGRLDWKANTVQPMSHASRSLGQLSSLGCSFRGGGGEAS
jgi:hypothetical protein